jgi:hypothetical protein
MLYTLYCQYKYRDVFHGWRYFLRYGAVYLGITFLSTFIGLLNYPYWDILLAGPVQQIEKLPILLGFLEAHGIHVDARFLTGVWMVARQFKGLFMEILWCFGSSYMIYLWYRKDWQRGVELAIKGFLGSLAFFFLYAIVDACYLAGSPLAKSILVSVNPFLHPIVTNNGWWPPLLWKGQLRSVFCEPSHVGNYLGVVMTFMMYGVLAWSGLKKKLTLAALSLFTFMVMLTKARTAYAMLVGVFALFIIIVVWKQRGLWKSALCVILAGVLGIGAGVAFIKATTVKKNISAQKNISAYDILNDNLLSLYSNNSRSNGARYALLRSNLRIFAEHPLLGVGRGLDGGYILDHYTPEESKNREVASWIRNTKRFGLLASGQGLNNAMNEIVTRLAEVGLLGLAVFLAPFAFVAYRLWRMNTLLAQFLALGIVSCVVASCNGSINLIWGVWTLLGLGLALVYQHKGE